ncbi:MAG: MFS transporter [Dehalococcoidia bacterium]|nr:MFS transporter [Dehalococcoidia bacterium]
MPNLPEPSPVLPANEAGAPERRPRFFYGWVIVAVTFLGEATASGAGGVSFSIFLKPMIEALGWSRTTYTAGVTFQSAVNLLVTPIAGPIIDRYGARGIMVFGSLVAGLCFALMTFITEPWQFYVLYALGAALGLHELGSLVSGSVVSKWFVRKRGRALAISGLGLNTGAIVASSLVAFLIDTIGWRNAWLTLGILVVGVVVPPTLLFMRRTPEDMGLLPDGALPIPVMLADSTGPPLPLLRAEPRWRLQEALRVRTTWFLLMAINMYSLAAGALVNHQAAYFQDAGFSLQEAGALVALLHAITIPAKLAWGFAAEHIPVRYCLLACYVTRLLGVLALPLGTGAGRVYASVLFSGLGQGVGALMSLIWADYYGRAFIGTIRGVLGPFSLVASLAGPLFTAVVYDASGSYDGAFLVSGGVLVGAIALLYLAKPPVKDEAGTPLE